ncbi:envelope biogenesis factor ElyC, partial [Vibrio parahaemolyticus]|nr:envelope biogenesis factor ElyC [Vibrio parahaemolyticus]
MFELKKVMSALLMPLPALLLIGLLGLALISFTTKRKTGCFVV